MKKVKQILSLLLTAAMLMSAVGITAFADDETLCEKVGITESLSSQIIKFDNQRYQNPPTLADNYQIIPLGDCLGVFSDPNSDDRRVSANAAKVALAGGSCNDDRNNANAKGYKFSIVQADKSTGLGGDDAVVGGQYVKAEKGSEAVYIPIVDSYADASLPQNGLTSGYCPDGSGLDRSKAGFAGRGFDETAAVFTVPAGAATPKNFRIECSNKAEVKTITTYYVSAYFDGETSLVLTGDGGKDLVRVAKDGTVKFANGDSYLDADGVKLAKGEWHRFAYVVNMPYDWEELYIDGVRAQSGSQKNTGTWKSHITQIRMGAGEDSGAGTIAFADFRVTRGYYSAADETAAKNLSDTISISGGTITVDTRLIPDVKSLKTAINAAGEVKIYTDSTKTAYADTLANGCVAVILSPSGGVREEYAIAIEESELTDMQKIGLNVSDTYTKGFHASGSAENTSNLYVKKLDNALAVFNNASQNEYSAYGWRVLETLSSSSGYELSLWDSTKTILRSVPNEMIGELHQGSQDKNIVTAGDWLKAEKGDEIIWIPVVDKIEKFSSSDLSSAEVNGRFYQGNIITPSNTGGLGGKSADDIAYTFKVGDAAIASRAKLQLERANGYSEYFSGTGVYTFSVNIYAEGDVEARIYSISSSGAWLNSLVWNADGSYTYDANGADAAGAGTLERGKWHKFAVTFDPTRGRLHYTLDGKLLTNTSAFLASAAIGRIDLAIESGKNGTVAFDDLRIYEGFYDYSEDAIDFKAVEAAISGDTLYVLDGVDAATMQSLVAAELVGASISQYDGGYLIVTPSKSYRYLTVETCAINEATAMAADNILLTRNGESVTAETKFKVDYEGATLYLARYAVDGALLEVDSAVIDGENSELRITFDNAAEDENCSAFLWLNNEDYHLYPLSIAKTN